MRRRRRREIEAKLAFNRNYAMSQYAMMRLQGHDNTAASVMLYGALIGSLMSGDQAAEVVERVGGIVDPDWPRPR